MTDLTFRYENNSDTYIDTDPGILREMIEDFSFFVDGFRWMPAYKSGRWNGKIYLIKNATGTTGLGLMPDISLWCKERGYSVSADQEVKDLYVGKVDNDELDKFIETLSLPFELRDYQLKAVRDMVNKKRIIVSSATGSGKSLMIYVAFRYLQSLGKKILLVVPNVSLLSQMSADFDSYAVHDIWSAEEECHLISAGVEKETNKPIVISTFQSLMKQKDLSMFTAVFSDECLAGDTQIKTSAGYKLIKDIKVGDMIINYNEKTKTYKEDVVVNTHKNIPSEEMLEIEMDDGRLVQITANHKVLTERGWVPAGELEEGDEWINI